MATDFETAVKSAKLGLPVEVVKKVDVIAAKKEPEKKKEEPSFTTVVKASRLGLPVGVVQKVEEIEAKKEPMVQGIPLSQIKIPEKEKKEIPVSPYKETFGFMPIDPDYLVIHSELTGQQKAIGFQIKDVLQSNIEAQKNIAQLRKDIKTIQSSPEGSDWVIGEDPTWHSKSKVISILRKQIAENLQSIKQTAPSMIQLQRQAKELRETKELTSEYKRKGWKVDITDTGYTFSLPSAYEVYEWGADSKVPLIATAFIESPLGVKTVAMGWASLITGEEKYKIAQREELASYYLGLQETLKKKDYWGYAGKIATSPAMVEGVYIPSLSLGAGYVFTGISKTATTVPSILSRFGATTIGKVTRRGATIGGLTLLGYGAATTSISLMETKPVLLPGRIAETGFTLGMAYLGYKAGGELWKTRHMGSYTYDWATGKVKWTKYEIPQPKDVFGISDVLEYQLKGKTAFTAEAQQMISGKKADIRLFGLGEKVPGKEIVKTSGTGRMTWVEKTGFLKPKRTVTRFFGFEAFGKEIKITDIGDIRAFGSLSKSELLAGKYGAYGYGYLEPAYGKGISLVKYMGKPKPGWGQVFPSAEKMPTRYSFLYGGKYVSGKTFGGQLQIGRILSFDKGVGAVEGEGFIGATGTRLKVDYGTLFKDVGATVSKYLTVPAKTTTGMKPLVLFAKEKEVFGRPSDIGVKGVSIVETRQAIKAQPVTTAWQGIRLVDTIQVDKTKRKTAQVVSSLLAGKSITEQVEERYGITGLIHEPGFKTVEWEREKFGYGFGYEYGMESLQSQRQKQGLLSLQKQKLASVLETVTTPSIVTTTAPSYTPPPIIPIIPLVGAEEDLLRKKPRARVGKKAKPRAEPSIVKKDLLSDLLSVTISHGKFGIATHPKVTKELWKMGKKSMYMRVPTVELLRKPRKKGKRRKKNVLI